MRGATEWTEVTKCHKENISIHAPMRGATSVCIYKAVVHSISIHAPMRGATACLVLVQSLMPFISIHAPIRGATIINVETIYFTLYFNPRAHEGRDSGD